MVDCNYLAPFITIGDPTCPWKLAFAPVPCFLSNITENNCFDKLENPKHILAAWPWALCGEKWFFLRRLNDAPASLPHQKANFIRNVMTLLVASTVWRLCGSKKRYCFYPTNFFISFVVSRSRPLFFNQPNQWKPYLVFKVIVIRDSLLWQGLLKKLQVLVLA